MHRLKMLTCVVIGLAVLSGSARAVPVEGGLDPEYGAALSTQATQTSLGAAQGRVSMKTAISGELGV